MPILSAMSIVEEESENIELSYPKFNVDVQFPNVPSCLPSQAFFLSAVGPPRSGKSSLIVGLLTTTTPRKIYNGVFDHIYLFCPEGSFNSMQDNPFKALDPSKVKFEFNTDTFNEVILRVEESAKKKENSLIIIDDFSANLKDVALRKDLERCINNRRHKRLSVITISQTYRAIPLSVRKLITHLAMFRSNNLRELDSIRDELVPIDKHLFMKVYNYVFPEGGDKHNFLFLNTETGEMYKKFTKLIIKN
jgi:hypothetical protein